MPECDVAYLSWKIESELRLQNNLVDRCGQRRCKTCTVHQWENVDVQCSEIRTVESLIDDEAEMEVILAPCVDRKLSIRLLSMGWQQCPAVTVMSSCKYWRNLVCILR